MCELFSSCGLCSCSGEVEGFEVLEGHVAAAVFVTLGDEVVHILIGWREGQVLAKHRFDVLSSDELAVTLVE